MAEKQITNSIITGTIAGREICNAGMGVALLNTGRIRKDGLFWPSARSESCLWGKGIMYSYATVAGVEALSYPDFPEKDYLSEVIMFHGEFFSGQKFICGTVRAGANLIMIINAQLLRINCA